MDALRQDPGSKWTVCPHLSGSHLLSCTVEEEVYVPSILELDEYCRSANHSACPFFCSGRHEQEARRPAGVWKFA